MVAQGRQRSDGSLDATTIGAGTFGQRDKGGKPKDQAEAVVEPVRRRPDRGSRQDAPRRPARSVRGPAGPATGTFSSISGGSHAGAVSWGHHRPTPTRRDPWMNPTDPADQPLPTPPATPQDPTSAHHPRRLDRLERIRACLGADDDARPGSDREPADRLGRGLRARASPLRPRGRRSTPRHPPTRRPAARRPARAARAIAARPAPSSGPPSWPP